jgi:hypothetical protein
VQRNEGNEDVTTPVAEMATKVLPQRGEAGTARAPEILTDNTKSP